MKPLLQLLREAAETAVSREVLRAASEYGENGIDKRKLRLSRSEATNLIGRGFLFEARGAYYPGVLTKIAAASTDLMDVCDSLIVSDSDVMHEASLRSGFIIHEARDIPLLHAPYLTSYYFECDVFLTSPSKARKIAADTLGAIVSALDANYLACCVSPEGLIGTYPICGQLSEALNLNICAMIRNRNGVFRFVGDSRPKRGRVVIIHDVLTTGATILRMHQQLNRGNSICMGALVIYDRGEGGREMLLQNKISVLSLMSLYSARKYCERVVKDGKPGRLKSKAAKFLAVSERLRISSLKFDQQPVNTVKIALAVGHCPAVTSFNSVGRLRPVERRVQSMWVEMAVKEAVRNQCSMVVFPELTLPHSTQKFLARVTAGSSLVVIGGAEYNSMRRNVALVAIDGNIVEQAKCVRSPYDLPAMVTGDTIHIFGNTCIGNFAVLICADQVDEKAINLLKGRIDFLVVVSRNKAINTFASFAAGDAYRLYACIIVANDRSCGGSLVASPRKGDEKLRWLKTITDTGIAYCEFPLEKMRSRAPEFLQDIRNTAGSAKEVQ